MQSIPDHQLDAFVDDELDADDRAAVLAGLKRSESAQARVNETRQLKDLLRLAYRDEKPEPRPPARRNRSLPAIAALLGVIAVTASLSLQRSETRPAAAETRYAGIATAPVVAERVLFHLSSDDRQAALELLDQVELVATAYAREERDLRILVITNNEGLRLYQAGDNLPARRIRELYRRFDNIVFAACGTTLRKQAAGARIELLPEVIVIDSGVAEIARRQFEGWKYIQI
jgi:hypothetical protein